MSEFGFEQTSFVGVERGDSYSVNMGFLSGSTGGVVIVTVNTISGTAGKLWLLIYITDNHCCCCCCLYVGMGDFRLITSQILIRPPGTTLRPIEFTLTMDSVAQEVDEFFTLKLSFDRSGFGPNDEICDEMNVTIMDSDSKFR